MFANSLLNNNAQENNKNPKGWQLMNEAINQEISQTDLMELDIPQNIKQQQKIQLSYILYNIFSYPSLEEAQIHAQANKLGEYDLQETNTVKETQNIEIINQKVYCRCCGFVRQSHTIPICKSFDQFPTVGISAFLFFESIKMMIYILLLVEFIVGIYSFSTNVYISQIYDHQFSLTDFTGDDVSMVIRSISLGSKKLSDTDIARLLYLVEMWMGVFLIIIWSFSMCVFKYVLQKKQGMIDRATISAADFSIIIENLPSQVSQEQLQAQLLYYEQSLRNKSSFKNKVSRPFLIQKVNLHHSMKIDTDEEQELLQVDAKYESVLEQIAGWVVQFAERGFRVSKEKRYEKYQKIKYLRSKRANLGKKILTLLSSHQLPFIGNKSQIPKNSKANYNDTKFAIITFRYSNSKDLISKLNQMGIVETLRYYLSCCKINNNFVLYRNFKDDSQNQVQQGELQPYPNLKIYKAPEPEDILWNNLDKTLCERVIRKTATYFVTIVLLGASFGCVYVLSIQQLKNQDNFYISILISMSIAIVNTCISFLIAFSTNFQGNYTETGHQTSLAIKSIFAQLINSIIVPIIANYLIEDKNIYGKNGLSTDIIYLAVTNSFLAPFLRIINPYYRYWWIKASIYKKSAILRLLISQEELNAIQTQPQFQIGYEYIYFLNLYLFTSFFMILQPIIGLIAIVGMIFMYWMVKYSLLNQMRRPVPGTDMISDVMGQIIGLGPIFYVLGSLTWSHFLSQYQQNQQQTHFYVPNLVGISISALFYIFPFHIIFQKYFDEYQPENLDYQECKILLNSEYDRMNPSTMQSAIREHEEYISNYIKILQEKNQGKKIENWIQKKKTMLNTKFSKGNKVNKENIMAPNILTEENYEQKVEDVQNYQSLNTNFGTEENWINKKENIQEKSHNNLLQESQYTSPLRANREMIDRKRNILKSILSKPQTGKLMNILTNCRNQKQILENVVNDTLSFKTSIQPSKPDIKVVSPVKKQVRASSPNNLAQKIKQPPKKSSRSQLDYDLSFIFPHEKVRQSQCSNLPDDTSRRSSHLKPEFDHNNFFGTKNNVIIPISVNKNNRGIKNPYDSSF